MTTFQTGLKTAIQTGGAWNDVSAYVYDRQAPSSVTTTNGRADETATFSPSTISGQLNNRDARFTSRNPTGPYYPNLGRNTPVRMSVAASGTYLRMEDDAVSYASTPDAAALQITGNIDVRFDFAPSSYVASMLAYKWGGTGTAWQLELNGDGTVTFTWFDGSVSHSARSTSPLPNLGRIMVRAMLTASTGTVEFWTAPTMGGSQTQLGNTVTIGTSTSVSAAAGQAVVVGHNSADPGPQSVTGKVYEFQLLNSSATLVADPVFSSQSEGSTSFSDGHSNTWTLNGTAEISGRAYIAHCELASLPVAWDPSGRDIWLPFTAGGQWRRLVQGSAPVRSPMRRAVSQLSNVTGYWPAEDLAASTQIASALAGVQPMQVAGTASFAADSNFACSNPVPTLGTSRWLGTASRVTGTAAVLRAICDIPSGAPNFIFLSVNTTGKVYEVDVGNVSGTLVATGYDSGLNQLFTFSGGSNSAVGQFLISVEIVNSGSNVVATVNKISTAGTVTQVGTSTVTTAAAGAVTYATVNGANANFGSAGIGHIFTQSALTAVSGLVGPFTAWAGEHAGDRFARLCGENSAGVRVYGFPDVTVAMGTQAIDTLPNLLQACEDADRGLIDEAPDSLSIRYRTLHSMLNQSPAVTINYSLGQAGDQEKSPVSLTSVDDDLLTSNDWIITRNGGSNYEAALSDGSAMSTGVVGTYENTKTVSLQFDAQLADEASWMLHVSTVADERYPSVVTGLHNPAVVSAGLGQAILAVRTGDMVEITNPPAWLPPGPIKLIVVGTQHQLCGWLHQVSWNCVPESPYEVLQYDSGLHWNTDGSTLSSSASSGATSLSVATTNGAPSPLWTTSAGDFPFTIVIDGETMTVTNITGASSPQTFTVTRSVNGVVKAHNSGAAVSVYVPPVWALT